MLLLRSRHSLTAGRVLEEQQSSFICVNTEQNGDDQQLWLVSSSSHTHKLLLQLVCETSSTNTNSVSAIQQRVCVRADDFHTVMNPSGRQREPSVSEASSSCLLLTARSSLSLMKMIKFSSMCQTKHRVGFLKAARTHSGNGAAQTQHVTWRKCTIAGFVFTPPDL